MFKRKPALQHKFTNEETQLFKKQMEQQAAYLEVIELLDRYSASFADWSVIINKSVHETITKKRQLNEDCAMEQDMLENLTFLFTRLAFHSGIISDWRKQKMAGHEIVEKMFADGHL